MIVNDKDIMRIMKTYTLLVNAPVTENKQAMNDFKRALADVIESVVYSDSSFVNEINKAIERADEMDE